MINRLFTDKIFCGLDLGAQHVKASLIRVGPNAQLELLGVHRSATFGLKNFSVSDLGELSESIHRTLGALSKKTGVSFKTVQLGINGNVVEARESGTVIPLIDRGSKAITPTDIRGVTHQAKLLGLKMDEEVLHSFPQYYRVDDVNSALNPLGLVGRKLAVNLLLIFANHLRLGNFTKAVHQAGYEVNHAFFSTLAAAEATLTKEIRRDGCVLMDIGSNNTEILIFKDGILQRKESISLGGNDITRAIAHHLNLSFDLSEDIKKSYAVAFKAHAANDEEILVKKDEGYTPIKRELISQAIEPEIGRWVENIQRIIQHSGFYDQLNVGIVMTGGGSLLPGLIERIEKTTCLPVRLGKIQLAKLTAQNAVSYAGAIGLAQLGIQQAGKIQFSSNGHASWSKSIVNKVKELYQEYF